MEACLFVAKPSEGFGQVVEAVMHHSAHCLDGTKSEVGRSVGVGDPLRIVDFL